jgi:hypothetical protein
MEVLVSWLLLLALALPAALTSGQESTYLGTVSAIETGRIQIRTIDDQTKREVATWFVVDRDTLIKRGDVVVDFTAARIAVGERVAVLVNSPDRSRLRASEVRLAAVPGTRPATVTEKPVAQAADPHAGHQTGATPAGSAMPMGGSWQLMQDGVVYGLFNRQGGPRGDTEFVVPNWWMGMLMKEKGRHQFGLNAMLSLDPATVGKEGYSEIFQVGETLNGRPLIDRQHPHDFLMQVSASWRMNLGTATSVMLAGGPAGEPTLGPIAFMHRPSAAGLVLAPLGHHTFDSTHISFGVLTAALEHKKWTIEGSLFNGREPDEHRWDLDLGKMDSVAGQIWFRPTEEWTAQVSTGKLREPEELVAGDAWRTTASLSWFRLSDNGFKAVTMGYGVNSAHGEKRHGAFAESTIERGRDSLSGRFEVQQLETSVLLTGDVPEPGEGHDSEPASTVAALTLGATRRLFTAKGFEGALGAQATVYRVPGLLKATHGSSPVSFQVFFRLRLPTGGSSRMWNMRMSQGHKMGSEHAGHVMR